MKRSVLIGSLAVLACAVAVASASPGPALEAAGPHGIVPPRGAGHGKPGSSPNLIYHGGQIMTSATVTPIFWGTNWGNSSFAGDKITGLSSFYGTIGGSAYINTNTEYTDSSGAHVGSSVTSHTGVVDTSSSLTRAPNTTTDILAEVSKVIANPVANGYYPVYTDLPRGHARYCAWHSAGTIGTTPVQFAFFFSLDGDPGCDPGDKSTTHSQGLEALANVSGHELSEALTDPRLDAWYDSSGEENADKCAWTFNGSESFGGSKWLIQGNWSNAAYDSHSGYDGAGCINGN